MSEPFIAEIKMFGGNFAPSGYAFCNGQLLPIAQNTALFALVGTTYGGDGISTFGLPNLQGRAPMHPGQGPGLSPRQLGQVGGSERVTLTPNQLPNHSHNVRASTAPATSNTPNANSSIARASGAVFDSAAGMDETLNSGAIGASGGDLPHNNLQPYKAVNFFIALTGLFPSRN